MEQIAEKIQLYHHLFLGCLVLALLCLVLSLALFLLFHISDVLGYLTGFRKKRAIRMMEEKKTEAQEVREGDATVSF